MSNNQQPKIYFFTLKQHPSIEQLPGVRSKVQIKILVGLRLDIFHIEWFMYVCVLLKIEMRWNLLAVLTLSKYRRCFISNSYKNIIVTYTRKEKFSLSLPSDCWMALWRRVVVKINQKQHPISVLGCHQHLSVPRVRLVGGLRKHHGREKLPHQKFSIIPSLWRLWKVVTGECGSNESRLKISQFLPSHPRCSLTSNS